MIIFRPCNDGQIGHALAAPKMRQWMLRSRGQIMAIIWRRTKFNFGLVVRRRAFHASVRTKGGRVCTHKHKSISLTTLELALSGRSKRACFFRSGLRSLISRGGDAIYDRRKRKQHINVCKQHPPAYFLHSDRLSRIVEDKWSEMKIRRPIISVSHRRIAREWKRQGVFFPPPVKLTAVFSRPLISRCELELSAVVPNDYDITIDTYESNFRRLFHSQKTIRWNTRGNICNHLSAHTSILQTSKYWASVLLISADKKW